MPLRRTSVASLGLAATMALAISAGCGSKPTVDDTAVVTPPKAPAEPAKAEAPAPAPTPEPTKDAPKG